MSEASGRTAPTEVPDGMRITWHQPIQLGNGPPLRAEAYRPVDDGR